MDSGRNQHSRPAGGFGFSRSRLPSRAVSAASGFSLLELLMVAAILIILSTLYWGRSSDSRQHALLGACGKNLQQIYVAMEIYATEKEGAFPVLPGARNSAEALAILIPRYTSETRAFICPGVKDPVDLSAKSFARQKIGYAYYMGQWRTNANGLLLTDAQLNAEAKAVGDPVFSKTGDGPGSNHHRYGGNLLFDDGRVERIGARATAPMPIPPGVVLLNP